MSSKEIPINCAPGLTLSADDRDYILERARTEGALSVDAFVQEGFLCVNFHFGEIKFNRIRRITGYLVGTVDRFNDAKRAEEHDRVKHGLAPIPSAAEEEYEHE